MGCDIHTFLEYSTFIGQDNEPYWGCMGGQFNTGRNYHLFGVLAGVRDDTHQLFEPRGLPEGKLSYQVEDYMRIRIVSDEEYAQNGGDSGTTLAQAQGWGETITNDREGKPTWVTNPDLHSHSWLTLAELKLALAHYMLGDRAAVIEEVGVADQDRQVVMQAVAALQGGESYSVEWSAVVAAMEAFEARGCQTRIIFCFDN